MLMIILDTTIVNVALPTIQADLGFSPSSLAWVVNAYLIPFGGLLLLAGRLGDLLGRRDVFLAGLLLFAAASLACGFADSRWALGIARFAQGIGAALTSSVILGMIVTMFPEPREQAKAIGIYSFVASAGGSLGLLAGGVLTEAIDWHWIFFVNLPIAAASGFFALRLVPRDRGLGLGRGADLPGAFLLVVALMLGVYAIVGAAERGWGSPHTLGFGLLALAGLAAFFWRQARAAQPLVPLAALRSRTLLGANAVQALAVSGCFALFFFGSLYLQRVRGLGALDVGLAFLPATLIVGALSVGASAPLNLRFGARSVLVPALLAMTAGLAWLAAIDPGSSYLGGVLPGFVLIGAGAGLVFPAVMSLGMSGVAPEQAGLASGLLNTTLQMGGAVGLAIFATFASSRTSHLLDAGSSPSSALTSGYGLAFLLAALACVVAVGLALIVLGPDEAPAGVPAGASQPEEP
ncbi:MAG TPA: MFS transporter [Solirubrobacterales bacterium]|nr:MFS transporter [Solirubrobacterales bacterium]